MAKTIEHLLAKMRDGPEGVRFAEALKVAEHFFGEPRSKATSHYVFKMPWAGDPRVNLQKGDGGKAKTYQVRQLVYAIDKLELILSTKVAAERKGKGP